MWDSIVCILVLVISVVGFILNVRFIRDSASFVARFRGVIRLITCSALALMSVWLIIYNNNLFWYGQNPENAQIDMSLNTSNVERTSFLYLLEDMDASTSVDDVIALMGDDFEESTDGDYTMRYETSRYTLNGKESSFISFTFNGRKTEILKIAWSYKAPSSELFSQMLRYLENNAFGAATQTSSNKADWVGLHLESTGYYLLLQRIF